MLFKTLSTFRLWIRPVAMAWPDSFCCGNGLYMDRDVAGSPDIWARLEGNMENMLVIEESIGYLPMVLEADSLAEGKP